jgi:hypothetical protein
MTAPLWTYRQALSSVARRVCCAILVIGVTAIVVTVTGHLLAGPGTPWWHLMMASLSIGAIPATVAGWTLARDRVVWEVTPAGLLVRRSPRRRRETDLTAFRRVTVKAVKDKSYMPAVNRGVTITVYVVNGWTTGKKRPTSVKLGAIGAERATDLRAAIKHALSRSAHLTAPTTVDEFETDTPEPPRADPR